MIDYTYLFCHGTAPGPLKYSANSFLIAVAVCLFLRGSFLKGNRDVSPISSARHVPGIISSSFSTSKQPTGEYKCFDVLLLRRKLCRQITVITIKAAFFGSKSSGFLKTRNTLAAIPNVFSTIRRGAPCSVDN